MGIKVVETQTYLGLYGKKLTRPRPGGRLGIEAVRVVRASAEHDEDA
jgi:hypothetical protein